MGNERGKVEREEGSERMNRCYIRCFPVKTGFFQNNFWHHSLIKIQILLIHIVAKFGNIMASFI